MENNATRKVQIHTFIPLEQRDELHRLARENERTLASEMRRAIVQHLRSSVGMSRSGDAPQEPRHQEVFTQEHVEG
jgi:hypothetical protein